jgi:hypothetical protein
MFYFKVSERFLVLKNERAVAKIVQKGSEFTLKNTTPYFSPS